MKKSLWLSLLCLPALASAATPEFAYQWPLQLPADEAGLYEVVLDRSVYAQAQSAQLEDVAVMDAQQRLVPALLQASSDVAAADSVRWQSARWFALPPAVQGRDLATISELTADGTLRRIQWPASVPRDGAASGYLIDVGRPSGRLSGLRLAWTAPQASWDFEVSVQASEDLSSWSTLVARAPMLELHNQGVRITRDSIELSPVTPPRYLRIVAVDRFPDGFVPGSVQLQLRSDAAQTPLQWDSLAGKLVIENNGQVHYEFQLPGRLPVTRVDVELPGNSAQAWQVAVRDTPDQAWRDLGDARVAYRIQTATGVQTSPPRELGRIYRERYWRLTPLSAAPANAPRLRVGYQPESVVFLVEGQAPFALVAGSLQGRRADSAVPTVLAALRQSHGAQWQPSAAQLGTGTELAGESALMRPRDWKTWLLWALLIGGAVLVTGLAMSLLRKPKSAAD